MSKEKATNEQKDKLSTAAFRGNTAVVHALLEKITFTPEHAKLALENAANEDHAAIVRTLLEKITFTPEQAQSALENATLPTTLLLLEYINFDANTSKTILAFCLKDQDQRRILEKGLSDPHLNWQLFDKVLKIEWPKGENAADQSAIDRIRQSIQTKLSFTECFFNMSFSFKLFNDENLDGIMPSLAQHFFQPKPDEGPKDLAALAADALRPKLETALNAKGGMLQILKDNGLMSNALAHAINAGNADLADYLIKNGANPLEEPKILPELKAKQEEGPLSETDPKLLKESTMTPLELAMNKGSDAMKILIANAALKINPQASINKDLTQSIQVVVNYYQDVNTPLPKDLSEVLDKITPDTTPGTSSGKSAKSRQ